MSSPGSSAATPSNAVKIIECPRDAWQGMPGHIPAQTKADYLKALIHAGFTHIDAVSFVSPAAVPQMADSEEVLQLLAPPASVGLIGIVVNERGAERAIHSGAVQTLGFPYSISATFLERNQKQTQREAQSVLGAICALAERSRLQVVAYVSMAFGNPYGDPWRLQDVLAACRDLQAMGIRAVSLADTVGAATPQQVGEVFRAIVTEVPGLEFGAHLHARPERVRTLVTAAWEAGCRRFDMALSGQGGCPFAQDALVGNVATETALQTLVELGAQLPRFNKLDEVLARARSIGELYGHAGNTATNVT